MQSYLSFALSPRGGCPEIRALDPYCVTRITPDYPLDLPNAMKLHDSEPRDDHREAHRSSTDRCATACAATGERGKEACYAPLPGAETVPASLRATE
jgi:hypothetical protein